MTVFGEIFGISLEIADGKIIVLHDGAFKKRVNLIEDFSSIRRVEPSGETYTTAALDPYDQLLDTTNTIVKLSTGLQKKVFSQSLEMGVRKIEVIQGQNIGQAVLRFSYNIERAMKWQLNLPFEKLEMGANGIALPQNIKIVIQFDGYLKYEEDSLVFSIQDGFSQIVFFIISELPYENIGKNLLLITRGDETRQDIAAMALGDEKFYPIVSFVYLQDFKNNITRYQDLYQIGSILALRHKHDDAISYLRKALEAVRAVGDQYMEAETLMTLATVESDAADYKQAVNDYMYASKIIDEFQFDALRLGCLLALSKNLTKLNQFQAALDNQYAILELMRTQQDLLGEAEVLVDISDSLMGLGHVDEAFEYQQAAIQIRRQIKDEIGEANNLMRYGEMLISVDRTGEAMSCYEQALRIKRNLSDERGVAECLRKMGLAFYNRGKYGKAKSYYEKAREAFQNQALILEVKQIDQLLGKMKERPYPEGGCEQCQVRCNPDIVGVAHSDAVSQDFANPFKKVLRDALSAKNMEPVVDLLLETSQFKSDLQQLGITRDQYAICVLVQAINIHLAQLSDAQKDQIVQMVQDALKIRRYRQM